MTQAEIDRLFDELAALVDGTPAAEREALLARLVVALAQALGDYGKARAAIAQARDAGKG